MAQAGFTPIQLYYSNTTTNVPATLANGELAINQADGKIFYRNNSGAVTLFSAPAVTTITFGSTGLTPNTATNGAISVAGTLVSGNGGTGFSTYATGDLIYASAANTLSKLTAGTNGYVLTLSGGVPTWAASTGGVTSFSAGTTGLLPNTASTGAIVLSGTLDADNGGTGQSTYAVGDILYASTTSALSRLGLGSANQVLAVNGSANGLVWTTAAASGVTSISFGTTGLTPAGTGTGAVTVAGTLATANGGTNLTSFNTNGAVYATSSSALTTGTLPTTGGGTGLTSFTTIGAVYATSTSALATGTLPTASGGTGLTTYTAGDLVYSSATNTLGKLGIGAAGYALVSTSGAPAWVAQFSSITFIIDGGSSVITSGVKGDLTIPFNCTITEWTLLADQSGSIVIDVWKDVYANYPPTVADSITGSAKPTITASIKNQSTTLTGWTSSITAGDTLRFNVDSSTILQRVTISLKVYRT